MKDEIKEKLLKGCGKECDIGDFVCDGHSELENGVTTKSFLCPKCQAKLQQHEETSKAKDEEFNKILDEANIDKLLLNLFFEVSKAEYKDKEIFIKRAIVFSLGKKLNKG